MKSTLIAAGSCLHENNHRKARVPFDGLFRGTHSFVVQFFSFKRTMGNRESKFYRTGARDAKFPSDFLWIANKPKYFAPPRASAQRTTTSANANYQSCFIATANRARQDAKTQAYHATSRRPIRASASLVRATGAPVQLSGVPYFFIASANGHNISGHNSGPDALARKQCRTPVFVALGRALGAGPHGPACRRAPAASGHA
jgi:hypothetical protein